MIKNIFNNDKKKNKKVFFNENPKESTKSNTNSHFSKSKDIFINNYKTYNESIKLKNIQLDNYSLSYNLRENLLNLIHQNSKTINNLEFELEKVKLKKVMKK